MNHLTQEQVKAAKDKGFLRNRGTDLFSGRIVSAGGVYSPDQLGIIAECARLYGNGKIAFTTRQSAEVTGIPYDQIEEARGFLMKKESGLLFGGTGARIRPITACKGTTCVFGCCDTQEIAKTLHSRYYVGMSGVVLPHKFKIAVGGCPNSCMKPNLNDFGIEARRQQKEVLFQIYVGGTWGKKTRIGDALPKRIPESEIPLILDGVLEWFINNAGPKERLGAAIDRVGFAGLTDFLHL